MSYFYILILTNQTMVEIREVVSNKNIKQFVDFPYKLYKNNPYWVPPIKKEEAKQLKPNENPAFDFCDAKFWLAFKQGKVVGRIAAIINHDYNKIIGRKMGRMSRLEFIDDPEVSEKLLQTAENFLKEKGMEAVHGPLGFTNFDNQGLLIEGFEYIPSIASVMHFPYFQKHIEQRGYKKENDWIEFRLKIEEVPEKATRLANIIAKRNNLELVSFKEKSELKIYLKEIFELLNDAFEELPYVAPFSGKMIEYSAKKYLDVLQPKYIFVIKKEGKILAFIVGMPSLSKAMQKVNGKLFPFGFIHIRNALKKPSVMDLLLTGVDPNYQKLGLPAILISELQKQMIANGVEYVETTGMFESNTKGITTWKNYDHVQHKRRRCYIKEL